MNNYTKVIEELKYLNILYIDEDKLSSEISYYTLGNFFKKMIITDNYINVFTQFKINNIDVIVIDLFIDTIKSLNFIKEIRKVNKNVLIIVMSKCKESYSYYHEKYFLNGFLDKPFNLEQFLSLFNRILISRKNDYLEQYSLISDLNLAISKIDLDGSIKFVNEGFCKLTKYYKEELIGKNFEFLIDKDNCLNYNEKIWKNLKVRKESEEYIFKKITKTKENYYSKITINPIFNKKGEVSEFLCLSDNVTNLINPKKQLNDFSEMMNEFIYVLMKIEDYEILTTIWGDNIINKLQQRIYKIINNKLKEKNKLFKLFFLENGEYGLIKSNCALNENILELIIYLKTLQNEINSKIISIEGQEFSVSMLMSLATEKSAIKDAPLGLVKLKEDKINFIVANNLSLEEKLKAKKELKILEMTRLAIQQKKIISYFQPIVHNVTQKTLKYESLVRLVDNEDNVLSPICFLDIAKKSKYYSEITLLVLKNSFEALSFTDRSISVNISMQDIENEETCDAIINLLKKNKSKSNRITFELLENDNIRDFSRIISFIKTIKYLGVKVAIDDFGVGYSNFERIIQYQPDLIKIDGSLIKNITKDKFSYDLVETITTFAKKQNIKTVAEYVENEKIYKLLLSLGVDYSQGYFFGKPIPLEMLKDI